jgi:hypothetical protein
VSVRLLADADLDARIVYGLRKRRLLAFRESSGLILIPNSHPIGDAVYQLELAVTCSTAEEFRNRITWLPY